MEHHDYRIYYVNIDLHRQYGISVAKSGETSLRARSKEKRLYSQATRLLILLEIRVSQNLGKALALSRF